MANQLTFDVVVFTILSLALVSVGARSHRRCELGQYFDKENMECKPCSECPDDHLVIRTCHGHRDTECGSLKDFVFQIAQNPQPQHNVEVPEKVPETTEPAPVYVEDKVDDTYWKTLSLALIGVLCAVSVLLAVFIVISCHIKRRRPVLEKEVIYETEYVSPEYAGLFTNVRTSVYEPNEERYVQLPTRPAAQPIATPQLYTEETDDDDDDVFEPNTVAA